MGEESRMPTSGDEGARSVEPYGVDWNKAADFYNAFAFAELDDTARYLDAVGIVSGDSVLDVCCGPGRISVLAAERAARVTGIDSAPKMLEHARANTEERGLDNVDFRLIDWECVLPGQNVECHDVVIASRCKAMMDVEKLSALAKRMVVVQIFADAPSIPELQAVLFSGCGDEPPAFKRRPPQGGGQLGELSMGLKGRPQSGYTVVFEKAYQAGYDPNVRIFPERFRKVFPTRKQALEWVCALQPQRSCGNEARVALNIEPFLSEVDSGVEFCIATAAAIIWWDVRAKAAWLV